MPVTEARADRLLLEFDGYNIVRRVYGAVPGEDTPEKVEGVFRSSIGSFLRAIKEFKPTHVLAAFDFGGHTFRHDMYPRYREGRKPMPEVLRNAMPELHDKLRTLGIPVVIVPGVEADDVLGTVGLKYASSGRGRAVIMSTDKDLAQLVPQGVEIRDQFTERWLDAEWAMKKFGVPLEQLVDCLALMSDTVDGIPGIDKVGPKTAAKWLQQYGDLDNVVANRMSLTGAVGKKMQENYEDALMSRELVRLKTDITLNLTWNQLLYRPGVPVQQAD